MSASGGDRLAAQSRADSDLQEPPPVVGSPQQRTEDRTARRLLSHEDYPVGWVCALPLELGAARAMLDEEHEILPYKRGDNNTYTLGRIGRHNVVLACLPNYGTARAAAAARDMLRSFPNIRIGLMVGIGGGVPGGNGGERPVDIRLGDVVVGNLVVQYDQGKTVSDGRFERTGGSGRPPPDNMVTAVRSLRGHHRLEPTRVPHILAEMLERHPYMVDAYSRPVEAPDRLFDAVYDHPDAAGGAATCANCNPSRLLERLPRSEEHPEIHYGIIASGNQVVKHGVTRDRIANDLRALCFEMEAAGLIDASFPCLVVRGISDYADSHKNKQWQEYAAATAAAYTKELLSRIPADAVDEAPRIDDSVQKNRFDFLRLLKFDEMESRQSTIKKVHPKTCDWLLEHSDYINWLYLDEYARHHGFLWISGKPGAGKSTLMKFAHEQEKNRNYGSEGTVATVSFFFNARGANIEKSTAGMYRSLIVQLLNELPHLQGVLDRRLHLLVQTHNGNTLPQHILWDDEILYDIFTSAVEELGDRKLTCFVDALDECDDEQVQDMVEGFEDLGERAAQLGVKLYICFSSRHYPHITIRSSLRLTLENQPGHASDLVKYVQNKLRAGDSQTVDEIRNEIIRKAGGVFLWVVLVVDILNKEFKNGRIFAVRKRLQQIPAQLSELFKDMLQRDGDNLEDLLLCIQWILFAQRPLDREEFYYALASGLSDPEDLTDGLPESPTVEEMNRFVLSSSKGLAEVTQESETVQFVHESVRDFFLKDNGFRALWPDFGADFISQGHERLKQCCHTYISVASNFKPAISLGVTRVRKWPFLDYATKHVLDHADIAAVAISQLDYIRNFDLGNWIAQRNVYVISMQRRYTQEANILYVLADRNLARLIWTVRQDCPRIDILGEWYRYPIFVALRYSHWDAVRAILNIPGGEFPSENGAFENLDSGQAFKAHRGQTPLAWAAERGYVSLASVLIETPGVELGSPDEFSRSPLTYAAKSGHEAVVRLLLSRMEEEDRDVQAIDMKPLARTGDSVALKNNEYPGIDSADIEGRTPLSWAALTGHTEIVQLLLEKGASIESKDSQHRTPLSLAADWGQDAAVQLLSEKYADLESRDLHERTPLAWAAGSGRNTIVQLLVEKGVNLDTRDSDNSTPLILASRTGYAGVVRTLLGTDKVDLDARDKDWRTALSWVSQNGYAAIVQQLLATGKVDLNVRDKYGRTPLSSASRDGYTTIVEQLLATGQVDLDAKDKYG